MRSLGVRRLLFMFSHLLLFDDRGLGERFVFEPTVSVPSDTYYPARTFRRVLPNFADWLPVFINDLIPRECPISSPVTSWRLESGSGHMPHSGLSSTQGDEASTSAGGLHSAPRECAALLLQEAEDNGSIPASPVLRLPRFPSSCWPPPNAPLMHRSKSWPSRVVRSRHRTRGRAAIPRPLPAVEYPPGMGDDYYGAGHLMDQQAASQMPLLLSLATGPAPSRASDAA